MSEKDQQDVTNAFTRSKAGTCSSQNPAASLSRATYANGVDECAAGEGLLDELWVNVLEVELVRHLGIKRRRNLHSIASGGSNMWECEQRVGLWVTRGGVSNELGVSHMHQ